MALYSIGLCQGWGSSSEKTTWLVFLRIAYLTGIIEGEECIDGVSLPGTIHMFKPGDGLTNLRGLVIVLIR